MRLWSGLRPDACGERNCDTVVRQRHILLSVSDKELILSSLEIRIVGIVVKMQTHFATIAMSIFSEPKVHATCLYSLNDENNICILLDASTVTQILKIRRATVSDIIAVQLTEQNNRTATILCQALQRFSHLRDLNIEGLLPVKSYQAKVVEKDYSALPFCIHRTGLGYDTC